jgi:CCR4-NOT complex subunit CAF16
MLPLTLQADILIRDMMKDVQAEFPTRRDELVELLGDLSPMLWSKQVERFGVCAGVNLDWRMHQLSDGQRRRVQIMLQLLRPVRVLLLDEITTGCHK